MPAAGRWNNNSDETNSRHVLAVVRIVSYLFIAIEDI